MSLSFAVIAFRFVRVLCVIAGSVALALFGVFFSIHVDILAVLGTAITGLWACAVMVLVEINRERDRAVWILRLQDGRLRILAKEPVYVYPGEYVLKVALKEAIKI